MEEYIMDMYEISQELTPNEFLFLLLSILNNPLVDSKMGCDTNNK